MMINAPQTRRVGYGERRIIGRQWTERVRTGRCWSTSAVLSERTGHGAARLLMAPYRDCQVRPGARLMQECVGADFKY